ncbi:MAG: hypothetical protein KBS95_02325 [Alistipes sp.]|nr:hypothetical protein [Candidatus Alistipes equi]
MLFFVLGVVFQHSAQVKYFITDEEVEVKKQKYDAPQENTTPTGKKRGRPQGSKNKSTLEKEKQTAESRIESQPKRKRGRPRKTIETDSQDVSTDITVNPSNRKRGRPLESKNKKTLEKEKLMVLSGIGVENLSNQPKRKRGRPRGSKNKKNDYFWLMVNKSLGKLGLKVRFSPIQQRSVSATTLI